MVAANSVMEDEPNILNPIKAMCVCDMEKSRGWRYGHVEYL